jgi:NDP-sugar pyrophosphorylase family protein
MERERITISIKKPLLKTIDKTVDGVQIRNRSHAIETLANKALNNSEIKKAIILLGGKDAMDYVPAAQEYLKFLKEIGFNEVFLAVGFLADKIKQKIGSGEEYGLSIKYLEKGEGSGGALLPLKKNLENTFVVINTANFSTFDYSRMLRYHKQFNLTATIATSDLSEMTGFYIFEPRIFDHIPKGFSMLDADIFPKLLDKNEILIFPVAN